jgi:hypothetical protein
MRSKSSIDSGTSASRATASRCSTAFVEPPDAATAAMAFSSPSLVIMRSGVRPSSSASTTSRPQRSATSPFLPSSAGTIELPMGEIPSTSKAMAMVFAVNWPPHAPAPGEALPSNSDSSSSDMSPAACEPTASKTSWIVTSCPWKRPGAMEPP